MSTLMKVLAVRAAKVAHPTGDPSFSVLQSLPSAFTPKEADPFLMCDEIGPRQSPGVALPDSFPVDWHPHRGQDLLTYVVSGRARHADSMGNRATVRAPGMQWMQAGSGIEHAEGGGTPKGETLHAFQIWINVPSALKMEDPDYGTVPTEKIPVVTSEDGVTVRVLSGTYLQPDSTTKTGPFRTRVPSQILDIVLEAGATYTHEIPKDLDNTLIYAYGPEGDGSISGCDSRLSHGSIARFDGTDESARRIKLTAGENGMTVLLFAGKQLKQQVAWHGPFVMTTDDEIRDTIREYRSGTFLKKRVDWNYKQLADAPESIRQKALTDAAESTPKDEL